MANLEPRADKAVRDAVDAFMDGRFVPEFVGETVFETKNSRYRLVDGVVFSAPDSSLFGAELVGWLCESPKRCLVESLWQPGSRAVLVDRRNERNIIVTSTTRLLHADEPGSSAYQGGSPKSHSDFRSWHPPPPEQRSTPLPPFSPRHAPIVASTPPPLGVLPTPPPPARPTPIPRAPSPLPPAPIASAAVPVPSPSAPRRGVHPPPRPIASPSRPSAGGTPIPMPAARPLPVPTPPPRRESPRPVVAAAAPPAPFRVPSPPSMPAEWEITSSEIEIEPDTDTVEPLTVQRHDASRSADAGPHGDGAEPVNSIPFPLVRPV
jgi:hypothetical protein